MMTKNNLINKKIYAKIREAENALLVAHERPDIDTVASVCAMAELLESMEKTYSTFCIDAPPFGFHFLPHVEKIISDKEKLNFSEHDLIIILDCGGMNRTKLVEEIKNKKPSQIIIEIDHHIKIEDYADIEMRDHTRASTTELVYEFLKANKIKINKKMANCILAGILTDTASFLYPSTSNRTIEISGEMLKRGANMPKITEQTWRNKSLSALKVWGKAMSGIKINKKYNIAFTILSQEDLAGISDEDLEGIPGFLSNMYGVKAVLVLQQKNAETIKGNLRTSHPDINVANLARILGGGGHAKAAGFVMPGKLEKRGERWTIT